RPPGEGVRALARERDVTREAARAAAAIIRRYYKTDLTIELKGHDDPLTAADRESNACIHEMISRTFPDDGWLSEETADSSARLGNKRVGLVDPLEGPKGLIQHIPNICAAIARGRTGGPRVAR